MDIFLQTIDGHVKGQCQAGDGVQGWKGMVHGGFLAALLDEAMGHLAWEHGVDAVTGRMEVRYPHPAFVGDMLVLDSWVVEKKHRGLVVEGTICNAAGDVCAHAKATMIAAQRRLQWAGEQTSTS